MFNVGDIVVYGSHGICKIDGIEQKQIGKETINYYALKPIYNLSAGIFVPVDNAALTSKMLDILTVDAAKNLIKEAPNMPLINFGAESRKREQYNLILASNNREELVSLIKTIRLERETRRAVGKKLNLVDEQTLRKAELLLFNELSFVLGITTAEAGELMKF